MSGFLATTTIPLKQVASFITNSTQGASVVWHECILKSILLEVLSFSYDLTQHYTEYVIGCDYIDKFDQSVSQTKVILAFF